MKHTQINPFVKSLVEKLLAQHPRLIKIVAAIASAGGKAVLVGGAVRDLLLGLPTKDLDIEVHRLPLDQLQEIMEKFGTVSLVGKSFGVLRLHGLAIDWSLPRADSGGRHPQVRIDPNMSMADAFKRRDLTINAMGIDLHTFDLIDPWGGLHDLQEGVLRAPDVHFFVQDPLRFFRVMQFIGRFQFKPDEHLQRICSSMSLAGISVERIEAEFDKLLLQSEFPSLGIRWLAHIGRLEEILPEVAATKDVPQEPEWHPEGDVFEHTMQALDAGAALSYDAPGQKLVALYALICHDLGKVSTTKRIDGRIRSLGHEDAGVPLARRVLKRLTRRKELIDAVLKLVKYHMAPGQFIHNKAKAPAYKRLALKLAPDVSLELLAKVALADKRGRNPQSYRPLTINLPFITDFLQNAKKAQVMLKPEEPVLKGKDLMPFVEPGPAMGKLLKQAYEIQIAKGIKDKKELLARVLG